MKPSLQPQRKGLNPGEQSKNLRDIILKTINKDNSLVGEIKVEIFGRKAVLSGMIESDEQKEMATITVKAIDGVEEVENNLRVDWMC
jgi:osmotically-inducible protein OsmY